MKNDCVFCKIVNGEIPSSKEYEDEEILAFRDINPQAPQHILIIPKSHIENLAKAKDDDYKVLGRCQLVAKVVAEKLGIEQSFRLLTASGSQAGQTVFHIHYHLVGGWKNQVPQMEVVEGKFP